MKRLLSLFLTVIISISLVACNNGKASNDVEVQYSAADGFNENSDLVRPDAVVDNCSLLESSDSNDSVTYIYLLNDEQTESSAQEKLNSYIEAIEKTGFTTNDSLNNGYTAIIRDKQYIGTIGVDYLDGSGYCILVLVNK